MRASYNRLVELGERLRESTHKQEILTARLSELMDELEYAKDKETEERIMNKIAKILSELKAVIKDRGDIW